MMLNGERALLVGLALRELAALEDKAEFAIHHHAIVEDQLAEITAIRNLIAGVPFGPDYLCEYDRRRKSEGHADVLLAHDASKKDNSRAVSLSEPSVRSRKDP